MTEKEFSQALRRGLGSALVELKNIEDKTIYREIILRRCLRSISYDWQVEGTKGCYLYNAIYESGEQDYFIQKLIEKFLPRCSDALFLQLTAILSCYADDGSETAKEALSKKYTYFAEKKGRLIKRPYVDEGFQWEQLACRLFNINGFGFFVFKKYMADIKKYIIKDSNKIYYDNLITTAEDIFGKKRIKNFLAKTYDENSSIKTLVDVLESEDNSREEHWEKTKEEQVTVKDLVKAAKEAALDENPRSKMNFGLRSIFMQNASESEIVELAHTALSQKDESVKALLLLMFWRKPFPLEITPLMDYAQSKNKLLSEIAISRLEEFKDKRLHSLAIQLLENNGLHSLALGLLKKNYKKTDDGLIWSLIKKSSTIPHHVQMDISDIYLHHRSKNAFPILHRIYQKGDCSYCRYEIVKAMKHCGVLPDEIIEECLYDSYDDTRKYANRLMKKG